MAPGTGFFLLQGPQQQAQMARVELHRSSSTPNPRGSETIGGCRGTGTHNSDHDSAGPGSVPTSASTTPSTLSSTTFLSLDETALIPLSVASSTSSCSRSSSSGREDSCLVENSGIGGVPVKAWDTCGPRLSGSGQQPLPLPPLATFPHQRHRVLFP